MHRATERFARGGTGQAGVTVEPFAAWIDDWKLAGDSFDRLRLSAIPFKESSAESEKVTMRDAVILEYDGF